MKLFILKFVILLSILGLALWLAQSLEESPLIKNFIINYGHTASFVLGVIGGLNLVVPIPGITFMPLFLEAGLNFWIVIMMVTAGMLLADTLAFILGKTGRQFFASLPIQNKIYKRIEKLEHENKKFPYFFLFLFASFAPFPNEAIVIPMGLLGYKIKNLALPLIAGNFIFNLLYALGVVNIFDLLK